MEQERLNSGCSDDDEEINGWPLGLPPVNARLSAASSTNNLVLPSCTSSSCTSSVSNSSDSDSESTTSFFPEKSTTLGSLIGIHSSSQFALVHEHSSEERHTGRSGGHRMLRSFLSCGGRRLQEDPLEASPSLSHYWDMDRREVTQIAHSGSMQEQERDMEDDMEVHTVHDNVYCGHESWARSHSCGPSLRLILQQPNPLSPWSALDNFSHNHSMRNDQVPIGSRLHHCWLGFCSKLSSSLAT